MTKESILFNGLKVFSYDLRTKTLKGEKGIVRTIYEVEWRTANAYVLCDTIIQEITEEEYEFLLKELENDR